MLWLQYNSCRNLRTSVEAYEARELAYSDTVVYVLAKELSAGEQVTKDMLTACTIRLPVSQNVAAGADINSLVGCYAKTSLKKGCIVTADLFYDDISLAMRNRYLEISDILLPENIRKNDLIDVRISFPNGEDFILLQKHPVVSLLTETVNDSISVYGLSLTLSEEELLRLSSARVDVNLYEGTYLYAVIYQADFENAAETTYPVNPDVFCLMQWDPNIVSLFTVEKEQDKRTLLENHLQLFIQKDTDNSILPVSGNELSTEEDNISQM